MAYARLILDYVGSTSGCTPDSCRLDAPANWAALGFSRSLGQNRSWCSIGRDGRFASDSFVPIAHQLRPSRAITGLMHRKKWTDTAATPKRWRQSINIKRSSTQNVARTPAYAARGMPGTNMRGSLRPRDSGTDLGSKNVPVV